MGLRITSLVALALLSIVLGPSGMTAAPAANDHTVLILGSTITGGASSKEAMAASAMGFDVEIASDAAWAAKTTSDFSTYRAIILGDPTCSEDISKIQAAVNNASTWGAAVDAKVLIIGSDPVFHSPYQPGAAQMTTSAMQYVLNGTIPGETSALIMLSCYYNNKGPGNTVDVLSYFGSFIVSDNPCHQTCHISNPGHPAMNGLTDASISNWDCPIHAQFTTWPENYEVLAIGQALGSAYQGDDGVIGTPYILALGDGGIVEEPCEELPSITINGVTPDTLWSPNHKMIDIQIIAGVGGAPVTINRTITCSETPKAPWTVFYEDGADIWHFKLRADRNGNNVGRTYTITYEAIDACGNVATTQAIVVVPHDQSGKSKNK